MNILLTSTGEYAYDATTQRMAYWRSRHHLVEFMRPEHLISYLWLNPKSSLAQVDAIVCCADGLLFRRSKELEFVFALEYAVALAQGIRELPDSCAMRDGKKWRSLPFIIFRGVHDYEKAVHFQPNTHARIEYAFREHPTLMLQTIYRIVSEHQQKILDGYTSFGLLVRFDRGHAQVGPALRKKRPDIESEYYYSPADRRQHKGWVTVMRDEQGLRSDVELFRQLIENGKTSEREMHKFLEEHPAFLMEARAGIPLSHRPVFEDPKGWTPDFVITPILGPLNDELELLELKGPSDRLLTSGAHGGFSAKVTSAVNQVRDYEEALRRPANKGAIDRGLGFSPCQPKLAVLIGRSPRTQGAHNVRERRQQQLDVQVVTYDEILAKQESQIPPGYTI